MAKEKRKKNVLKTTNQDEVVYGNAGLAKIIGGQSKEKYKQYRELHLSVKGLRPFPAHREQTGKTYRHFYIRSEVIEWFKEYGKYLDKQQSNQP